MKYDMIDVMLGIIFALFMFLVYTLGWMMASSNIARECTKLNGFYVGKYVYECREKNE